MTELDNETAIDEIVADYTQKFMKDTEAFREFVNEGMEERSLGEKLIACAKWVLNKIKQTVSGKKAQNAAAEDILGVDLEEAQKALALWEKAYYEAKEAVKNTPAGGKGDGVVRNMASAKYWRPDLTSQEWDLLNREMNRQIEFPKNFLDQATKWLYADVKGIRVFAFYGIGDGTDPTPLYFWGGKKAQTVYSDLQDYLGGRKDVANPNRSTLDRVLESLQNERGGESNSIRDATRRGEKTENVPVLEGERGGNKGRNNGKGHGNSSGKVKYSVTGTEDILFEAEERAAETKKNKDRLEYLRKQVAVTKKKTVDPKAVTKLARNIIAEFGVSLDTEDISQDLQALLDHALRGDKVDIYGQAVEIGRQIAEDMSQVDGDIFAEYAALRKELKNKRIYVSPQIQQDIADYIRLFNCAKHNITRR